MNILKRFIGNNEVDDTKIRLSSNSYLRARNAANTGDINLLKVNASDILEFASMPIYNGASILTVAVLQYNTGTASQSGTTITGSGTVFTASMVGSYFYFGDTYAGVITAFTNGTTLTVNTSQTVSSTAYAIYYPGLEVGAKTPPAPVGIASPTGGTIAANTYYAVITALNPTGVPLSSVESTGVTTTGSTSSIAWTWPAVTGATSYQIWVTTTSGSGYTFFTSTVNSFTQTASSGSGGTLFATNYLANAIASRGAHVINTFGTGLVTTVTAAGTTTLTGLPYPSATGQQFTGSTTQTVVMPDARTLPIGTEYRILNRSTGVVTVNANGGGLLAAVNGGSQGAFALISNNTAAGTWDVALTSNGANLTLSNLTSPTAINQALLFGSGIAGSLKTADNTGTTQNLFLGTGQNTSAAAASGTITVQTGQSNPTAGATSGGIALNTGNAREASGGISFNTGLSNNAASGGMSFNIGNSQNTNSGNFSFLTGTNGGSANTGGFTVTTGNCTTGPSGFYSGSINLVTGSGLTSAGSGNISLVTGSGASAVGTIKFFRTGIASNVGQPWIASAVDGTGYYASSLGPAIYGLSTSQPFYNTGTASQSGTIITGSGTTFTAAMVGMYFVWGTGLTSGIITAFTSGTQISVSTSQTIGAGTPFSINRPMLTSPLATPSAPSGSASGTGGTVPAGTNFAKIIAVDGLGNQSAPSNESPQINTAGATSSITWTWAPVPGAVSYQIWVSTTTGTEANFFTSVSPSFVQTLPAASGTSGTIPTLNSTRPTFVSGMNVGGDGVSLNGSTSGSLIQKAAATTTSYTTTWPASQGGASTVLTNDGAGNLSWAAGGSGANTALSNLTATSITQNLIWASNEVVKSADSTSSNDFTIKSGDGSTGTSGNIVVQTGTAVGTRGSVLFNARGVDFTSAPLLSDFSPNTSEIRSLGSPTLRFIGAHVTAVSLYSASSTNTGTVTGFGTTPTSAVSSIAALTSLLNADVAIYTPNRLSSAGTVRIEAGNNTGTGGTIAGSINLIAGGQTNAGSSGAGGTVTLATSNIAGSGNSGGIFITVGTVAGGTRGSISLSAAAVDFNQVVSNNFVIQSGATGSRPISPVTGQQYFDTTLSIPIWYNGTNWVDATGTTV